LVVIHAPFSENPGGRIVLERIINPVAKSILLIVAFFSKLDEMREVHKYA